MIGPITAGWERRKLGELLRIKHGYAFKGEYFSTSGPYIVLTPGNFHEEGGFHPKTGKEKFYTGTFPNEYILSKDALIVAMTEQGEGLLGSAAVVPTSDLYLHNQRLGLITEISPKELDRKFLYYLFNTHSIRQQIRATANGAKVRHTSPSRMYDITVDLAPLSNQRKIAAILSAYDDLIENNTRRIQILEEMAQILYREWFVHFHFPEHEMSRMVESELGPIPEGWAVIEIRSLVRRLTAGNTYTPNDVLSTGQVRVIDQSRDSVLGYHNSSPDYLGSPDQPVLIFGDHTCKMQMLIEPFSIGPNVIPFVSNEKIEIPFLFYAIKGLTNTREYKRHWTELTMKKVLVGPTKLIAAFSTFALANSEAIARLQRKNHNLRQTRDLLLPKLISGELDVADLDIVTGEQN